MKKFEIKKIKKVLKVFLRILAERAFLVSLTLIFLASFSGVFVFYNYDVLVDRKEIFIPEKQLQLEEEALENILEEIKQRQGRYEKAESREFPDFFRGQETKTSEELTE